MIRSSRSSPFEPTVPVIATSDVPEVAQWLARQPAFSTLGHTVLQQYPLKCAVTHALILTVGGQKAASLLSSFSVHSFS